MEGVEELIDHQRTSIKWLHSLLRHEEAEGHDAILGHETVVYGLHVVFHFVWSGEFLAAHGAGKNLPLVALVVQKGVPLEAVLVLEGLLDVGLRALGALVDALGYGSVAEKVETSDRHLRELLGRVLRLGGGSSTHPTLGHLPTRGRAHRSYRGWTVRGVFLLVHHLVLGCRRQGIWSGRRRTRISAGHVAPKSARACVRGRRGCGRVCNGGRSRGIYLRRLVRSTRFLRGAHSSSWFIGRLWLDTAGTAATWRLREICK